MAANENFAKKNAYSKIKYVRRKQQKFLRWICPRHPTTRGLCDFYARKDPSRIMDLRLDTLSQLLGHADIHRGGRYLLWDDSKGFILGAMLARIGACPETLLVNLFGGSQAQTPTLPLFNLTEGEKRPFFSISVGDVGPEPLVAHEFRMGSHAGETDPSPEQLEHRARFEAKQAQRRAVRELFDEQAFDALVLVAQEHDPCQLLDRWPAFLRPSGRVVVYCRWREPLLAAFVKLRSAGCFVDVALNESWARRYQTAAGRLHPEMTMNSHGGFLLTATRVVP